MGHHFQNIDIIIRMAQTKRLKVVGPVQIAE